MNRRQCICSLAAAAVAAVVPSTSAAASASPIVLWIDALEAQLLACFARLPDVVVGCEAAIAVPGFDFMLTEEVGGPMWGAFEPTGICQRHCFAMWQRGWLVQKPAEAYELTDAYFRLTDAGRQIIRQHNIDVHREPELVRVICNGEWERRRQRP